MDKPITTVLTRNLKDTITDRLVEEPVIILNGARTVGKSTLLKQCADLFNVSAVDLDDLETREAVKNDPSLFAAGPEPICIDEFQHILPLLDAIKAQLNKDMRPGRFILTGSTRYATLPHSSQSLTGRAHILTIWPLSQGELRGKRETFFETLVKDPSKFVTPKLATTNRLEYESMVLAGGFPLALARATDQSRHRWFQDYVTMVIERDVLELRKIRQHQVLPEILRYLAAQTGQLHKSASIATSMSLDKSTVADYIQLLESVFLIHRLEAFGRTLSSRINRSPKVHLVDTGLAAHLLGITTAKLANRDPSALSEFGHLLETFAVNEILKQASWSSTPARFSHFRTKDGYKVDLICEIENSRIFGIEVKASATLYNSDFKGLQLLRDKLGDNFLGGIILHLGTHSYTKEDRLYAIPLDRIWN